tara:strand:+ start:883 stop:1287 length:405 start_codon:yes stop_codon:yes gene_type:complete
MIKIKIGSTEKLEGAVAVLLDEEDKTLLLLRPESTSWAPGKWGFPGGRIEPGESPRTAAAREATEETTLEVRNLKAIKLKLDRAVQAYYTRDYSGEVKIDHEHDDWAWVSRDELQSYELAPFVTEILDWIAENE